MRKIFHRGAEGNKDVTRLYIVCLDHRIYVYRARIHDDEWTLSVFKRAWIDAAPSASI